METSETTFRVEPRVLKLGAVSLMADELHLSLWLRAQGQVRTFWSHGTSFDNELYELGGYPLTEQVLTSSVPAQVLAGDPAADAAEVSLLGELGGFRALLMVPVMHEGETVGLLEAYRLSEMGWTQAEVRHALAFGRQVASAMVSVQ